jgi:tetratricopeptide (TPR) repeat protein
MACHERRPTVGVEWFTLSVLACLAGMATKEVMVTAPLLVLLYDRTFLAGSFAAAWRQRRGYYGALAATWLLLAWLVLAGGGTRGDAAGLGLGVSCWAYLLKQSEALVLYLKLSLWPHPLVVDYGTAVVRSWTEVWWQGSAVLALLAGTAWGLWRRPALGFLGAWFFVILAPSSSVVPLVSQTMAEHRMYLPLVPVIVAVVLGSYLWAGRRSLVVLLVLAVGAGWLTVRRNGVYRSELSLWSDTVAQSPANSRAHTNLGIALFEAGRIPEAVAQYEESLRLEPASASTHLNLCNALVRLGRAQEAVPHGEEALRLNPGSADAHVNLAAALAQLGRTEAAITHYEEARRLQPAAADVPVSLAAAYYDLGNRAAADGNLVAAITRYRQALELAPDHLPVRNNLANTLLVSGRIDEAIAEYRQILRQHPDDRSVQENLARALEWQRANRARP